MQYKIQGEPLPVVICQLEENESMVTERGSMVWMSENMVMDTKMGGVGKAIGRAFSKESVFQNVYTAKNGPGIVAFASSFTGSIKAVRITPDCPILVQKSAFLASTKGIELSVAIQHKVGAGLFGGEGFILQKISGNGMVFLEIDGSAVEYVLAPGQKMIVQTGNLAMADASVKIDIQTIKGVKNIVFGGEGLFNTTVTGPGRVTFQTMALNTFVEEIMKAMPGDKK